MLIIYNNKKKRGLRGKIFLSSPVNCPSSLPPKLCSFLLAATDQPPYLLHTTVNHCQRQGEKGKHCCWNGWLACRTEQLPGGQGKGKGTVEVKLGRFIIKKPTFFHKLELNLEDKREKKGERGLLSNSGHYLHSPTLGSSALNLFLFSWWCGQFELVGSNSNTGHKQSIYNTRCIVPRPTQSNPRLYLRLL